MDIRVEWYDGRARQWVQDQYLGSLAQALIYAPEEAQIEAYDHRVVADGEVYALITPAIFRPKGGEA